MEINSNKGMYLEQLVNRTSAYFIANNLGIIEKRQIPTKVLKKINEKTAIVKLLSKAKVDYFIYFNNIYCEIECKETSKSYLNLNLVLKHQHEYLQKLNALNIHAYLLVYFSFYEKIMAINYAKLTQLITAKKLKKKINFKDLKLCGIEVPIVYPGILDITKIIDYF